MASSAMQNEMVRNDAAHAALVGAGAGGGLNAIAYVGAEVLSQGSQSVVDSYMPVLSPAYQPLPEPITQTQIIATQANHLFQLFSGTGITFALWGAGFGIGTHAAKELARGHHLRAAALQLASTAFYGAAATWYEGTALLAARHAHEPASPVTLVTALGGFAVGIVFNGARSYLAMIEKPGANTDRAAL